MLQSCHSCVDCSAVHSNTEFFDDSKFYLRVMVFVDVVPIEFAAIEFCHFDRDLKSVTCLLGRGYRGTSY